MNFKELKVKQANEELSYWLPKIAEYGFIAGGAIRSWYLIEPIRDLDIFIKANDMIDGELRFNTLSNLISNSEYQEQFDNPLVRRFVSRTDNVTGDPLSSVVIDLIKPRHDRWMKTFGTVEEVISAFDFTVCRAAMIDSMTILADEDFEEDVESRTLRIKNIVCPISTVKRVAKYGKYGYSIKASQVIKLFTEWENRPEEERTTLSQLLQKSEEGKELNIDEMTLLGQMLYID